MRRDTDTLDGLSHNDKVTRSWEGVSEIHFSECCLHEFIIPNGQAGIWARYTSIVSEEEEEGGGRGEECATIRKAR